jgi:ribosomal protein S18 acetylase RimI-like enzyme
MADTSALVLRPAASADVKTLAEVLARAFYDDPPLVWLLPNATTRLSHVTRMFETITGVESLGYGGVDVACGGAEIAGGAVWLPPGHRQPGFREKMQAAPSHLRTLVASRGRAASYGRALEAGRPKEPHWYLKAIGVDPAWQGRGVAGLLLRSRLERCDASGQPAYLEVSQPGGVALYERFGFQRIGDLDMPAGAPVLTGMWRAPAS